jgi:hypothetical protein
MHKIILKTVAVPALKRLAGRIERNNSRYLINLFDTGIIIDMKKLALKGIEKVNEYIEKDGIRTEKRRN